MNANSSSASPVSDYDNPDFLFSTTNTNLLVAIAAGTIDPVALARRELAGRGLDRDGAWVGFVEAARVHAISKEAVAR